MADKSTKFETLPIWGEQIPTGQTEFQPKAEIWRLLGTSQLQQITSAGAAYTRAAEAVTGAVTGIDDYAGKILSIWQGPDADQARVALEAMYATGRQLARALADMGRALETYAGYVPTAIAEVNGITVDKNETAVQEEIGKLGMVVIPNLGGRTDAQLLIYAALQASAVTRVEDARAQEVLKRLNEKIRSLYISSIPFNINYELPTVTVPSTSGTSARVVYGDSGGTPGTTSGGRDGAGGAADGGDGAAGVAGTAGQEDDRPSATDEAGPGTEPDEQPGHDQAAGQDPPQSADQPGGQDQPGTGEQTGEQGADAGAPAEDDIAPQVIGSTDGTFPGEAASAADPLRTEAAAYQPPTPVAPPTIGGHAVSTPTPTTSIVPSVTVSPNTAYPPGTGLAAVRGGSPAGVPGMPFPPMLGGGGATAGEGSDLERSAYLPEDRTAWNGSHEVTDPVIG